MTKTTLTTCGTDGTVSRLRTFLGADPFPGPPKSPRRENQVSRRLTLVAVIVVTSLASVAPAASAAPLQILTPTTPTASWAGERATGTNVSFVTTDLFEPKCSRDIQTYCDDTLVKVSFAEPTSATLRFRLDGFDPQLSDFDLRVYQTNSTGFPLVYRGSPTSSDISETSPLGADDPRYTSFGDYENKIVSVSQGTRYYLVRIVYFAVVNGTYTGSATLTGATS
jgi:hypothetical protein